MIEQDREFAKAAMATHAFGGNWTAAELERVHKYLTAYTTIFARNPRAQKLIPMYVDAFAGTGYRSRLPRLEGQTQLFSELRETDAEAFLKGSARIALEVEPPFKRYIFIEQDGARARELEALKRQFPHKASAIQIVRQDANDYLKAWCAWTDWQTCRADLIDLPKRWREPRLIFVNSMSDLFHEHVPLAFIQRVFATMRDCPHHTFQVLTKRSARLRSLAGQMSWPSNVWVGVSVEHARVLHRIDDLRAVPAMVRFLSCEPLLGPLDALPLEGIHWVIAGGESGPGARPIRIEWIGSLLRQCRRANVPFFFKQWGGVRKDLTGRKLDGRTYDEMPRRVAMACPSNQPLPAPVGCVPSPLDVSGRPPTSIPTKTR
jgi:protein gp37